jgi:hypothetical protein
MIENKTPELIASHFVAEGAQMLVALSAALLAAACAADQAAVEACLWQMRRALVTTIGSWREFVPPLDKDGDSL